MTNQNAPCLISELMKEAQDLKNYVEGPFTLLDT